MPEGWLDRAAVAITSETGHEVSNYHDVMSLEVSAIVMFVVGVVCGDDDHGHWSAATILNLVIVMVMAMVAIRAVGMMCMPVLPVLRYLVAAYPRMVIATMIANQLGGQLAPGTLFII